GDTIYRWKPGVGAEVFIRPSTKANGLTFDKEGRLCVAGWASRSVWRVERDGSVTTLASHYQGKRINSPNDIVVRSDGSIYFTDSPGALYNVGMASEDLQQYLDFQGVFRISPDGKKLDAVVTDTVYPNGLAFTPDESVLYVNDTRLGEIRAYDMRPDGSCGQKRLFHKLAGSEPGIADGMKVDREGNVYCTGPGGIHVIAPDGKLLGRIRIPDHCTNMAWGDADWRSLYVTTYGSAFRTRVNEPGVPVW
ncbi:MAG: SMP-30/gluconolactonase/LRE family protein, partial [Betaproteobacteria bacterium]